MDFNDYTNPVSFDLSSEEKETIEAQVRSDHAALVDAPGGKYALKQLVKATVSDAREAQQGEHYTSHLKIVDRFQRDLLDDLDISDHPKANLLYNLAWDRFHSSGFEAVYYEAKTLAELISD